MDLQSTLGAMQDLMEEQVVRNIGVSNFTPTLLAEALKHANVFANQVEYHPYLNQHRLLKAAIENDHFLIAYSPLARGTVTSDRELKEIGGKHNKTASQVSLRWLIQQSNVIAIPKSSSDHHLKENQDIFDFHLTEEEMRTVSGRAKRKRIIDPSFAPDWE